MKSKNVIEALGALAQESRLSVYRLLVKRGPAGYNPGEIAERLGIPSPTLSFHLKELQNAGLVVSRRDGRFLHYNADFAAMRELVDFLTENCCSLSDSDCDSSCNPVQTVAKRKTA